MQMDGWGYRNSDWSVFDDLFAFKREVKIQLFLC
jgi:hypothetical protein